MAARHEFVVVERVRSPVARRLARACRWIDPGRLGLVVQPKFSEPGVPVLLADVPGEDFERLRGMAPLWLRLAAEALATLGGLLLRLTASRESVGRQINATSLPHRDDFCSGPRSVRRLSMP